MKHIFGSTGGGQGPTDDPQGDKERQAVKECTQKTHRDLQFDVVGCLMGHHVMGESCENSPPITGHIEHDEKSKENGKKYFQRSSSAFIDVEDLMQGVPPKLNNSFHSLFL